MPAPKQIRLIVGLGNPGSEYAETRHNIGFATVDELARRAGSPYWKNRCGCDVATVKIGGRDVLLAKPQAFMNLSGGPVSKLCREERITPDEVLVVHDELDLPAGDVRARFGGGLNAHNGLRSMADKLTTRDFGRVRCGIGRPPGRMEPARYVLQPLKGDALVDFELAAAKAADACEDVCAHGLRP